jgi:hypothetical protein
MTAAVPKGSYKVVVSGITTEEDAFRQQVNKRGFVVEHYDKKENSKSSAILEYTMKLKVKLTYTVEHNLTERSDRAMCSAIDILKRCKGIKFEEAWIIHDQERIREILHGSASNQLVAINDYFGSEIAFYVEWLQFYTKYLTIPAVSGLSLFIMQQIQDQIDSKWSPLFSVMMCIWGSVFIESWKRRSSELCHVWDVENSENLMDSIDITKVHKTHNAYL